MQSPNVSGISTEIIPKQVALAASGGLDTSCSFPWPKERYGYQVLAAGEGFIRLFGLGQKLAAHRDRRLHEHELEVAR